MKRRLGQGFGGTKIGLRSYIVVDEMRFMHVLSFVPSSVFGPYARWVMT